jgi:EAL domain-containing protein (putative c-di-GMP-specific phosphodiesterase class I)
MASVPAERTAARPEERPDGPEERGRVSDLSVLALQERVTDFAKELSAQWPAIPDSLGLAMPRPEAEVGKALVYTINRFCAAQGEAFSIDRLSENIEALAADALYRVRAYRDMVAGGTFETAFQPIVDIDGSSTHHFEALVRFGQTRLDCSPFEFITFAEQVGLIHEFDIAMCRKVLDFLVEKVAGGRRYMVAVNLSADSLANAGFMAGLSTLLSRYEAVRDQLIFEVTESAKIEDLAAVNAFIQSLRRKGHMVCLDDFGSGAAAFQYLQALEVDVVKIDGGYVKSACATAEGKLFLKAMAGLLQELGIAAIAEMVEDDDHLTVIRDCGIGFAQGYVFGRPSTDIASFAPPSEDAYRRRAERMRSV